MKKHIDRIIILGVTGIPGAQKLLILLIVGLFYPIADLASYINDSFIVMMLTYFTAINWSSILIADINKYPRSLRNKFYATMISNASTYCIICSIAILFIASISSLIQYPLGAILFVFSYTYYQLWRHYLLAKQSYLEILILDVTILILFWATLYLGSTHNIDALIPVSITFLFPFIYTCCREKTPIILYSKCKNKLSRKFHYRALFIGVSGFSTASPALLIAPISFKILSVEYTSVIGFMNNIVNIIYLIPRAYSLYNIPLLAQSYNNISLFRTNYTSYRKRIHLMLCILLVIILAIFAIYMLVITKWNIIDTSQLPHIYTLSILMLLSGIFAQFIIPIANLSNILRTEKTMTYINILVLLALGIIFCSIFYESEGNIEILLKYQLALIISIVIRYYLMTKLIRIS